MIGASWMVQEVSFGIFCVIISLFLSLFLFLWTYPDGISVHEIKKRRCRGEDIPRSENPRSHKSDNIASTSQIHILEKKKEAEARQPNNTIPYLFSTKNSFSPWET